MEYNKSDIIMFNTNRREKRVYIVKKNVECCKTRACNRTSRNEEGIISFHIPYDPYMERNN